MVEKKKLTIKQKAKVERAIIGYGNRKIFLEKSNISVASLHHAIKGKELSFYIIDKIIKAL